jgi:hypothetical protein
MSSDSRTDFSPTAIRLGALWVLAGALFKLIAGTPADLPPVLHELPVSIDLFFKVAIGIELALVATAFLRPKLAWIPLVGLYLVFGGILSMSLGEDSCGCFGSSITIPPSVMMGIDTLLLLAILISKPWKSESKGIGPLALLPLLVLGLLVFPTFYVGDQSIQVVEEGEAAPAIEDQRYVILEVESWKDQLIYDTDFAALFPEQIETLPTEGLFMFWRWDCDHCAEHLVELTNSDDMSKPIVLIRLNQDSDTPENRAVMVMPTGGHVTELELPAGPQYVVTTPAEFELEGAMVVRAEEGIGLEK